MSISSEELRRIVKTVWSTQLGIELDNPVAPANASPVGGRLYTLQVEIGGAFTGELVQACSGKLGLRAAAAAFHIDPSRAGPDQVRDTLGELAHMTAGNLKSMLPGSSALGLPRVRSAPREDDGAVANARFSADGEMLEVSLIRGPDRS